MDYAQSRFVLGTTGCELNGLIFAKIRDERVLQKDFDSAFTKKGCYLCTASRFRLPDYDRLKRNHFVYTAVFGNFSAHFNRRTNSAYNIQNPTESETGGFSVIELIQHGMYLVNGVPCESVPVPPAEARRCISW